MFSNLKYMLSHPLNRGGRLKAISRVLAWQLGARLVPGPVIIDHVGTKLIARRGGNAVGHVYNGLNSFNELGFILHAVQPGTTFVDVGANIGSFSLPVAARGGRVIAFEPGEAFEELTTNFRLNGMEAELRREALGASEGSLSLTAGLDTINRAAVPGEPAREVPLRTLDGCVVDARLVKIDVEGFEAAVISGGKRVLRGADAVILEMNGQAERYGFSDGAVRTELHALGLKHETGYDPLSRRLIPPNRQWDPIFVRDPEVMQRQLLAAPPFLVRGRAI